MTRRPTPTEDLPAGRLAALRDDLASRDAARGQQAVADFLRSPDTVPFLKRMLLPGAVPARRLADLIADLDHDEFARRQRASQELERIGEQAAAALRRSLEARPSLEARRRMSLLLEALDEEPPSPRAVRMIRALQVLEGIGTPEARRVIEDLSCGDPKAHRTREAKASLERLARRPPS